MKSKIRIPSRRLKTTTLKFPQAKIIRSKSFYRLKWTGLQNLQEIPQNPLGTQISRPQEVFLRRFLN